MSLTILYDASTVASIFCGACYCRKCEEEWLRELEREVMRPVVGVEVHEIPYPDGTLGLVVTAVAQVFLFSTLGTPLCFSRLVNRSFRLQKGTAHKAGVQIGDIVSKFGKTDVQSKTDFAKALLASPIGSKQNMQVLPVSSYRALWSVRTDAVIGDHDICRRILQVIRRSMAPIGKPCTSVEWLSVCCTIAVAPQSARICTRLCRAVQVAWCTATICDASNTQVPLQQHQDTKASRFSVPPSKKKKQQEPQGRTMVTGRLQRFVFSLHEAISRFFLWEILFGLLCFLSFVW